MSLEKYGENIIVKVKIFGGYLIGNDQLLQSFKGNKV